ncbi:MAG TPA: DUF3459 domain-containing protein, partial [Gemmatirosa sp.]|nr:DUF3459 domain-containing protein [Gemmatirosa sp.]
TSTLALYRRLLALRRAEPALRAGAFRLLPRQGDVLAYLREDGAGGRFLVLVNFAAAPGSYALAGGDATTRGARVVAGTHARPAAVAAPDRVALEGNEAVVFRLGRGASSPLAPEGARRRVTKDP